MLVSQGWKHIRKYIAEQYLMVAIELDERNLTQITNSASGCRLELSGPKILALVVLIVSGILH